MHSPVVGKLKDERALATINVRMPQNLKTGAEAVLEREGVSVSEAIRRFYVCLEELQELPDCIRDPELASSEERIAQKREVLKGLLGIASSTHSLEHIRDERISRHFRSGVQ